MEGKKRTDNIWLCPDGKYRWVYEFHMMKNPMILLTVLKVFGIAAAIVALFAFAIDLFDDWQITLPDPDNLKILLIVAAVFIGIIFVSYLILAGIYGWKYEVLFEMDDESVSHIQMPKQYKKAEAIAWITAIKPKTTPTAPLALVPSCPTNAVSTILYMLVTSMLIIVGIDNVIINLWTGVSVIFLYCSSRISAISNFLFFHH